MKNTKLSDSAEIYNIGNKEAEKPRFSDMDFKEKLQFFNAYYRNTFIICIILLAAAIYVIYSIFSPKTETVLSVAIINEFFDEKKEAQLIGDISSLLLTEDSDKQELYWDSSYYISNTEPTQATISSEQRLATYLGSGQIDVLIMEKDLFETYIDQKVFLNLAEVLPTDLFTLLSNDLYIENDNSNKLVSYGLSLKNSEIYKGLEGNLEDPVLGIVVSTPNQENSISLIRHLFSKFKN